ncbi:VWA domain-containing protein [Georgenia subflava]|uniref:VWA domain-containing protein n=1 Tax=Georgenia subflava TaxID=1622177 RepID=A0A6N7ERZ7_9MICO|nr:VWA domain-containing protein [Georgenia subflava]MPV38886.1 VWA domain-containing protein [Georgenia subflava]
MTPWLVPLVLVVIALAALAGWFWRGRPSSGAAVTWVANSAYLRGLSGYRRRLRVLRGGLVLGAAALALTSLAVASLTARPVDRDVRSEILATRDIVLCLDVSGSMIELDTEIVQKFSEMVDSFEGERIALSVWNNTSRTVFPLTDDYALVKAELDAAATALDFDLDAWVYDQEALENLEEFLTGTVSLDNESSSLVGDGLATCALAFDAEDTQRSRSIILATDNLVLGTPIYTLPEAAELSAERDIAVHGLYASMSDADSEEARAELEQVVTGGGGLFFEADDPGAVDGIIEDIEAQQAVDLDAEPEVVITDRPDRWYGWLVGGLTVLLLVLWRVRS